MKIQRFVSNNSLQENTYIYSQDGFALIIDPGVDIETIKEYIQEEDLEVLAILLTHGHGDHISSVPECKEEFDAPIVAHKEEQDVLQDPEINLSTQLLGKTVSVKPDILVEDGDILDFEGIPVKIIHTPGHTAGGVCILINNNLFTGDTMFRESAGRTDLYGGSMRAILRSLRKLSELDPEIQVFSGHGPETTIGHEKDHNTFITRFINKEI